jgi:predicted transglutaminase-like cysteine proteinase
MPRGRSPLAATLVCLALAFGISAAATLDIERLLATLLRLGGQAATLTEWQKLVETTANLVGTEDKLRRVNEFFNRRIQFGEDQQIWGQSDYWATPMETLAKGKGDCEDFTIAKYFTLLNAGIPNEQLRLVYVKARIGGMSSTLQQAHMVLVWYATPDAEPLVLDNLIADIRSASRRPDLQPVFSFNSQGIWQGVASGEPQSAGGVGRLSRWQDLLQRARQEGFD